MGKAKIYSQSNGRVIALENFSISAGPDLKVYLSKSAMPNEFVNLGSLASNTIFNIPSTVNISEYKFVLIHCQQYNHLFATALLN